MLRGLAIATSISCWAATAQAADQPVTPPSGAIAFCMKNQSFCAVRTPTSAPASALGVLENIDHAVNTQIVPIALNTEAQKREENRNWRIVQTGEPGACAEYAIRKFSLLADQGIPTGAMRLAEVRTDRGELHLILLVDVGNTAQVLDNLTGIIWPAGLTKYQWVAVQDRNTEFGWIKPEGAPQ